MELFMTIHRNLLQVSSSDIVSCDDAVITNDVITIAKLVDTSDGIF